MRYQGSEAYNMSVERQYQERLQPSLEVVPGGGLDARARAGVSPLFVARLRVALAVAAVLITLGVARVALSAATVSLLQESAELSTQISEAQTLNNELRAERSALASNSRISRIATQNYGMVLSTESVTLTLDDDSADAADEADEEAAQSTDEAEDSSDLS